MKAEHTKGPWLTFGDTITADDSLRPGYTVIVAHMGSLADNVKHPASEVKANAQLIAAAPELLEALQYIVGWKPQDWDAEKARDLARAAIAKASGKGEV